jgi:hypothetical protein
MGSAKRERAGIAANRGGSQSGKPDIPILKQAKAEYAKLQ